MMRDAAKGLPVQDDEEGREVAAVDLGSNSFHMVLCRLVGERPLVIERTRDQVQLRAGLDAQGRLSREAQERALRSLRRFRQLLGGRRRLSVRACATNTFRSVRDAGAFHASAEEALGHPIEIVSGEEEARLIWLGVSHAVPHAPERRVVFDIGGGSTEFIFGEASHIHEVRSFDVGCVSWSGNFFPDGRFEKHSWEAATTAARNLFSALAEDWREKGWGRVVGTSGTIRSTEKVLRAEGLSGSGVPREALQTIVKRFARGELKEPEELAGLKRSRHSVYLGGLAILVAAFEAFDFEHVEVSQSALREGIIFDLLGFSSARAHRTRTVRSLQRRFLVDRPHASRVAATAERLRSAVAPSWELDDDEAADLLEKAASLHEIGMALSHKQHHLHAAYLISNSTMPGFSPGDCALLAGVVGAQRGRLDSAPFGQLAGLSADRASVPGALAPFLGLMLEPGSRLRQRALGLALILRVALMLHRDRSTDTVAGLRARSSGPMALGLELDERWLAARPITLDDLRDEVEAWEAIEASFAWRADD